MTVARRSFFVYFHKLARDAAFRYPAGVIPVTFRNISLKYIGVLNPHRPAMSSMVSSVSRSSSSALSILRSLRYLIGDTASSPRKR